MATVNKVMCHMLEDAQHGTSRLQEGLAGALCHRDIIKPMHMQAKSENRPELVQPHEGVKSKK